MAAPSIPVLAPAPAAELAAFVDHEQRLPRLGDTQAPWRFRGWLLPCVIQLHALIPTVADRWGYHLRTLEQPRRLLIEGSGFSCQ